MQFYGLVFNRTLSKHVRFQHKIYFESHSNSSHMEIDLMNWMTIFWIYEVFLLTIFIRHPELHVKLQWWGSYTNFRVLQSNQCSSATIKVRLSDAYSLFIEGMLQHGNDWFRTQDRRDTKQPPYHLCYLAFMNLWVYVTLFFVVLCMSIGPHLFLSECL